MNDHPNTLLMQQAYDAFAAGDLASMRELIAEDAVWYLPRRGSAAGVYRGREAILDYCGELFTNSDGTFNAEVLDILADDERVMALQHSTASRGGRTFDIRHVLVSEVRDGQFVTTQIFTADPDLEDTFWART